MDEAALLIPPVRLGRLLKQRRIERGLGIEALCAGAGVQLPVALVEDIESGVATLDSGTLALVAEVYDLPLSALSPQRAALIIDLDEGVISAHDHRLGLETSSADEVMTRYLALVYTLRELPIGTEVPLRMLDVGVLGQALELGDDEVCTDLQNLMTHDIDKVVRVESSLRRKLVVPLAGILVGATALGGLVLVRSDAVAPEANRVDVIDAVVINHPGASQAGR